MTLKKAEAVSVSTADFWEKLNPGKNKLYNYIRKSLNFSTDADDVYQETVLHAFRYLRTYENGRDFTSWLFGIAHNEIRKFHQKNPRVNIPFDAERLSLPAADSDRPLVAEIYQFAERLAPRHREVFFLFYDQGFTIPDIARITGFREGNIKFILHRARKTLKAIMGENHE